MAAGKRKGKKRKDDYMGDKEEDDKPSNLEYEVAKWLRSNIPTKRTKFINHTVEYFLGSKAVDGLMESKFATGDNPTFGTQEDVVEFLNKMLIHKFFHRARRVPVSEQELRGKSKKKDKEVEREEPKKKEDAGSTESQKEGKVEGKEKEKEAVKKRKVRLEMHNMQVFLSVPEAYVWIYDPIPFYYWIIGALLVLGAIGVCMFPLWPQSVRKGVYYISVAAAGFLVLIIALTTLRLVVFCLVWLLTFSRHHFWLLPNLTEDVGFLPSFWPLYKYEYRGPDYKPLDKKKRKKKDKASDDEDGDRPEAAATPTKSADGVRKRVVGSNQDSVDEDDDREDRGDSQNEDHSGHHGEENSESEGSQRSSTGKDFEMVDAQDVDTS